MKKTIKYLDNDGNYQYATVKDAGDLDKLKTKAKEDLVSAINELATNGVASGDIDEINNKVDQIQQQVNQNADALNMNDQERQEMQQQIAQMQAEAQDKIAEMQKLAEEQNKKLQEASAELKKKADAIDVQKMQQDNAEALKNSAKALEDSLAATNEDLKKTADHLNEMEIQAGVVETSVKELQNGFESKVSSADFNEARTKLQEQETMVRQLNNELSTKASNNELDMVTQRVQKAESDIQQNAQGIKASVTKETMFKEMDDFAKYRENRLKYSRDFSNDWSLNGNDIIDDDHLFDTQHDVKSVSIRNGAYLTQTTDLDTDDMSKTFTLAMWVEKGKRPRAWYGSAELTNMKVKEDKGDYQRVYWTFVPTIVKQDIRITGDTSTQGNLIISEPKLEQSDRPSAWSTNTGDQYATTEKLAHDLKLTADKLESTITKQSEFSDRQQQDESRITQTEHGVEVANQTIVAKTDGLRQEFDGKISATSKSLTSEYQSFTNRALGQMADGGANLILNSSFGSLKNSFDKWTNVNPKARIVTDDNGLKWVKLEQSGLTANSPIGLTSNLFRVKKGIVTVALDIRTDNAASIDNDNIVILESYNAEQKRVFTKDLGFSDFKITRETLFDHGSHRVTYKYNQTRDDTQYMAVHILLPKNGILYATNVLARTIANGEDSGEYAPNDADLREQVVQQRTRIEQNDQAIALKADQTKVTQDIDAAKSSLSGAISKVEQRAANLEVKADGITSSVSTLSKTIDGISVGGTNLLLNTKDFTGDWYQQGSASLQDLDGRKVIHAWADWSSYRTRQVIQLEQNTDYTISADIRSLDGNSSDNTVTIHGVLDGKDTQLGDLHTNGKLSSKQQRFSAVWHNTSAGQLTTFRLEGHGGWGAVHGSIYISHIKLEKGNKTTDWSPAPEDTDSSISSLQSRASKLEQTDSEIKATVTSVTNDLKNGKATLKEGIMSMADDHFETKFSSIDNKIDGISVGGRNLLLGTSTTEKSGKSYDFAQYSIAGGLKPNTTYTFSGWARVDQKAMDNKQNIFVCAYTNDWSWSGWLNIAGSLTAKYNKVTFTTPTGNNFAPHVTVYLQHPNNDPSKDSISGQGFISRLKLEEGNKATSWTPSPEDVSEEIKSAKDAAIKVASDQIDIHVNELSTSFDDKLNKRVNEVKTASEKFTSDGIEQTVKKITDVKGQVDDVKDKVNNLKVGGRNLVRNTDTDIVIDDTGNTGTQGWCFAKIPLTQQPKIGDQVTVSAKGTLTGRGDLSSYSAILFNSTTSNGRSNLANLISGKRASVTLTVNNLGGEGDTVLLLYAGKQADTEGKKNVVHHLKVEFGNVATDWTPAPEDVNQKIDTQTLDSANIDDLKTQGHYFVRNLTGNPIGGWVYVDVTGNNNDRIRQDVYQDNGSKHMYRRGLNGTWSGWEQGAYLSDVNAAKTEVTASVKNLGDRVTTEVSSVETRVTDKINGLGGGRNFVRGTSSGWSDWSGFNGTSNQCKYIGQLYWNGLNVGDWVTFHVHYQYQSITGDSPVILVQGSGDKTGWSKGAIGSGGNHGLTTSSSLNFGQFDFKFQVNADMLKNSYHTIQFRVDNAKGGWLQWAEVKAERGVVRTPWSPAPEDTAEAIKTLNTKWDVANGQIQGKVTATDVNNILNGKGYATQSWAQSQFRMKSDSIDLEVKKITDPISNKINNLQVGGRNLLLGTSESELSGRAYNFGDYQIVGGLQPGRTYTLSGWGRVDQNSLNHKQNIFIDVYTDDWSWSQMLSINASLTHQYNKITFTTPTGKTLHSYVTVYLSHPDGGTNGNANDSVSGLAFVKKLKLEEGNVATDWTPAPEDINKKIDTQTLDSANIDQMKTQGHYFVKNLTGNPVGGWVYVDVTGNGNDRIRQDVYQDNGSRHKYRRLFGSSWTAWIDDVNKDNILSQINISPEKIRLLSNKIEIDGNTYIHGTLNVPEVVLQGKTGTINLNASNGIQIKNSLAGSDNMVQIGYGSIWLGSSDGSSFYNLITSTKSEYYNKNHRIGAIGQNNLQDNKDIMGMTFFSDMGAGQRDSLSPKYLSIGYAGNNLPAIQTQIRLNNQDYTDNDGNNYKRGVHIEDSLFIRYRDINLTGSKIFVDDTPMAPIWGWVSWSKWKNVHHIALVNPNGFAGYAMSEDGSPVLFGRGTTVGMGFNGGSLEIGSQGDMSRWPSSN